MIDQPSHNSVPSRGAEWTPLALDKVAWLFPQFAILGMLGRGTVGAVYRGFDAVGDRTVAIKIFPLEVSLAPEVARRFAKALPVVTQLAHAHIVRVLEFGLTAEEHLFLIEDHVEGTTLRERIEQGELTPAQVFAILEQVCDAAHHAHGHGVVHGALHPGNVFVDLHGPVKVADFGIAQFRLADDEINGARAYLAPEQVNGLHVDHRADVFSAGVMLYEALTGELPHADSAPASARVSVHPRIDPVIARAMNPSPEARYHTSAELMRAIAAVRGLGAPGAPAAVGPVPVVPGSAGAPVTIGWSAVVPPRGGKKTPLPLMIGAAVVAVALGVAAFFAGKHGRKSAAPPTPAYKVAEWPTMATPAPPPPAPKAVAAIPVKRPKLADAPVRAATPVETPVAAAVAPTGAGTWVSVPLEAGSIGGATAGEGGGVHLTRSVQFNRVLARDLALRVTIRLPAEGKALAEVWLRYAPPARAQLVLDSKPNCFIQTAPKDFKFRTLGTVSAPWVLLDERWVTVEVAAIGDKLFGAVNGRAIPIETPSDVLEKGTIGLFSNNADFKDLAVMILDGVPVEQYPEFVKTAQAAVLAKTTPEPAPPPMAPDPPTPEPAKASPEVETWLLTVAKTFEGNYQREVTEPFASAVAALRNNYVASVERQSAAASQAGKLEEALAWRNERKLFFDSGHKMPADDSDNPLPAIKPVRAAFRAQFAKLDRDRYDRARAHFGPYDAVLAQNQTALTQRQRLEDALLLKTKREQLTKDWLVPPAAAPQPVASGLPVVAKSMGPPEPPKQALRETVAWLLANGADLTVFDGKKWGPVIDSRLLPNGKPAFKVKLDGAKFKTPPTVEDLQRLKNLRAVTTFESNTRLGDAAWTFLPDLEGVEQVQVPGDTLSDAIADSLAPLNGLKNLHLRGGASLTGKTFGKFAKMSKLRSVDLESSGFNDEGAAAVSALTSLEELHLRKTKITDAGLVHLAKLRNLRRLGLNETAVTIDGLAALKGLKNLESIGFLSEDLPDYAGAAQKMAAFFPRLLSTRVLGKSLGKEHFAPLASWRSLTHLAVSDAELRPGATAGIGQISTLEWLEITSSAFGDIDVEGLLSLKGLKRLTVTGTKLTDSGLLKLKALKSLREVNAGSTPVTPEGARALEREHAGCKVTR